MTIDMTTKYLGLTLAHPVVAAASPLTGSIDSLFQLQEAGAAAVVLSSLFEEQIEHDAMAIHETLEFGAGAHAESPSGYFPGLDAYNSGPDFYLDLLEIAKQELSIPVIASLNGATLGGWTSYARLLEDAGADAVELNVYRVAADVDVTGAEVEETCLRLVAAVRGVVEIPVAVKVGPFFSSMANMARRLVDAGADGLVLFNRFYQPDFDLEELTVVPHLVLSTSSEMRLVLRWMAILRGRVEAALAATTGVHTAEDVVKLILAGADVAMMASALLEHGPQHLGNVVDGVRAWFDEHEYASVAQGRGSLSQASSPDPSAFERANYMKTLTSYAWRP